MGFHSNYAELAMIRKNNMRAIDDAITQYIMQLEAISLARKKFPLNFYGNVNYAHDCSKNHYSNNIIALAGFDFAYSNCIFKRVCSAGIFAGAAKSFIHFQCDDWTKGNLHMGFLGYYGQFQLCKFDITNISVIAFGQAKADWNGPSFAGTKFSQFTHQHRDIHSKISVARMGEMGDWKLGPEAGLCFERLKQKGAKEWQQETLRGQTFDIFGGIRLKKGWSKLHINLFCGALRNLRRSWSGGGINLGGTTENPTLSDLDRTKIILTAGLNYPWTKSCSLELDFSGRYGSRNKSSALGLTINVIF
jgi:hypothetical protein